MKSDSLRQFESRNCLNRRSGRSKQHFSFGQERCIDAKVMRVADPRVEEDDLADGQIGRTVGRPGVDQRRLGKVVTWANYVNGGHGTPNTTESDFVDYHQRVLDWYAKYLLPVKKPNATSQE